MPSGVVKVLCDILTHLTLEKKPTSVIFFYFINEKTEHQRGLDKLPKLTAGSGKVVI